MTVRWEELARSLADALEIEDGLDTAWRECFATVPRHRFVPKFLDANGEWVTESGDSSQWLGEVYADTNLITQVRPSGAEAMSGKRPTSSSSMPGIMAWMLQALDVTAGDTVLEIGTGTGYNAALLCQLLGSDHVTSIDIDPDLIDAARYRLNAAGYTPTLITGDGADGYPDNGPYDAILATASVDHVPPDWIEQLNPGGRIVADLRGDFSGAMTTLRKIGDETVQGRCHSIDAAFMPMRRDVRYPLRHGAANPLVIDRRNPQRATTSTDAQLVARLSDLRFIVELQLGATRTELFTTDDEVVVTSIDASWATATLKPDDCGLHQIQQGGPRRVWDSVEAAFRTWHSAGRPALDDFGVTASADKHDQRVWLNTANSPHSWPLPI
ncbi:MAG TPA: methyltransferase domain-containing protein [Pseudonocardiaceae bacterium]|jgi:protein-L-isoaspartate(D-aspartate) O-methyltransferase|nr:methyltransferase domain-containing protein [Pseudonocardiaceae bacterium]